MLSLKAGEILRKRDGDTTLREQFATGVLDVSWVVPLLEPILAEKVDETIWQAALALVGSIKSRPRTPPRSLPPDVCMVSKTSTKTSSLGTQSCTSGQRIDPDKALKKALKNDVSDRLWLDVPDFDQGVFGELCGLDQRAEAVFKCCQPDLFNELGRWKDWPDEAHAYDVLKCLQKLEGDFKAFDSNLSGISRRICAGPNTYITGSFARTNMDIGYIADGGDRSRPSWNQMLVVGELKKNAKRDDYTKTMLDIAKNAFEVFTNQHRRFVLGFSICGSIMRLFHFDRSGICASDSFDVHKDRVRFVKVMLGYLLMNEEQLGFDSTIQQIGNESFLTITRDGSNKADRIRLLQTISKRQQIVGRGTVTWEAYNEKYEQQGQRLVVKDSWQCKERPEEGELIRDATRDGVTNIAVYVHHETVQIQGKDDEVFKNVRRGLMTDYLRTKFRMRKSGSVPTSESSRTDLYWSMEKRTQDITSATNSNDAKRCRLDPGESQVSNRVHRRIITSPPGKPIMEAQSPHTLLNGFIGVIKGNVLKVIIDSMSNRRAGLESLRNANILHCDISKGNIMLNEDESDGFLIDFDLATKIVEGKLLNAPDGAGTIVFMAIGALQKKPHNFLFDLESVFWVLFWVCIFWEDPLTQAEKKPDAIRKKRKTAKEKRLRENAQLRMIDAWKHNDRLLVAGLKLSLIPADYFEQGLEDCASPRGRSLIPCLKDLRDIMFPGGRPRKDGDSGLYSIMKGAIEKAQSNLIDASNFKATTF